MAREKTADNIPEFGRTGKSQNGKLTNKSETTKFELAPMALVCSGAL
ncbi:MAG: hypothetical protein ABSC89_06455 [Verrucomicrobiota bacterium]|jgi:hypothetical protein